jgi:hypothetical protein
MNILEMGQWNWKIKKFYIVANAKVMLSSMY